MGIDKAREPGVSLETIVKRMRAEPRTAEAELALADFMMLSVDERLEILFLAAIQVGAGLEWVHEHLGVRRR